MDESDRVVFDTAVAAWNAGDLDRSPAMYDESILRLDDGRCVERWSVADPWAVLLQIGAETLPG